MRKSEIFYFIKIYLIIYSLGIKHEQNKAEFYKANLKSFLGFFVVFVIFNGNFLAWSGRWTPTHFKIIENHEN